MNLDVISPDRTFQVSSDPITGLRDSINSVLTGRLVSVGFTQQGQPKPAQEPTLFYGVSGS